MKTKKVTINKNGKPRKKGSGRKKGSNSFVRVTYGELKDYIGEKTPIAVSRVWLESLGFSIEGPEASVKIKTSETIEDEPKISFSIKEFDNE